MISKGSPIDQSVEEAVAAVLDAYLRELEMGTAPPVQEWLQRHPHLADELREPLKTLHDLRGTTVLCNAPDRDLASSIGQLGNHRLLRELGRGGMGVVYEAEDLTLRRRVALKILPFAALLTETQLARFTNEAQAAARLNHPHIVPVYAVGCDRGVHYYAMQYIDGASLDRAIDELRCQTENDLAGMVTTAPLILTHPENRAASHDSDISRRTSPEFLPRASDGKVHMTPGYMRRIAQLGRDLALALQHAHDQGILHRDIKPSNLLLDHRGHVWITDFGLAHIPNDTTMTQSGDVLGSCRYMSPEQAAGKRMFVDHRADVYSLGITLYELLTLTPAFPTDTREEFLHLVKTTDPPAPRRLNRSIPVALDAIVSKAIQKEPQDRYETAADLAADLERFLDGRAIIARERRFSESVSRWLRRHRRAAAITAAVATFVGIVSLVASLLVWRAQRLTELALVESQQHLRKADDNYRSLKLAVDEFGLQMSDRLSGIPGTERVRSELLQNTLAHYQAFIHQAVLDPTLNRDIGAALLKAGRIHEQLGDVSAAMRDYNQAVEIVSNQGPDPWYQNILARAHNNRGLLACSSGDLESGLADLQTAEHMLRQQWDVPISSANGTRMTKLSGSALKSHHSLLSDLACTLCNQSIAFERLGRHAEAWNSLRNAITIQRELLKGFPADPEIRRRLAISLHNLGLQLLAGARREFSKSEATDVSHDVHDAESAIREALTHQQELRRMRPDHHGYVSDLALGWNNLAAVLLRQRRVDESSESHRRAIKIQQELVQRCPQVVAYRCDLAIAVNNFGRTHLMSERPQEALTLFQRAATILRQLQKEFGSQRDFLSSLGGVYFNMGMAYHHASEVSAAKDAFERSLQYQREACELGANDQQLRARLSEQTRLVQQFLQSG